MNIPVQFMKDLNRKNSHGQILPIFIAIVDGDDFSCKNCSDRGFITAFYADHPLSARGGAVPPQRIGRVTAFFSNGWWYGEYFTARCPACEGDPTRGKQSEEMSAPDWVTKKSQKYLGEFEERKKWEYE